MRTTIDPEALALSALAATLADDARAERFLTLTGLDAATLRARAGEKSLLAATLAFLESHEPDLISVAAAIGVAPVVLVDAHRALES